MPHAFIAIDHFTANASRPKIHATAFAATRQDLLLIHSRSQFNIQRRLHFICAGTAT